MTARIFITCSIICLGILSNISCSRGSGIEEQIVDRALTDTTKCVALSDITKFDWDTMYFFWGSSVTPHTIDSVVGTHVWSDLTHQVVFVKNKKVVYREVISNDPDKKEKASFDFPDTLPFECLTPQTAIFKIHNRFGPKDNLYNIVPCKK